MDAEIMFYIIAIIALSGWLWYKVKTCKDQYMSQEWLDSYK